MLLKLSTIALIPALIIQGYQVKKNTPRLPEAEGNRKGNIGQGKALSILILGDSAAAGVGVEHQQDALLGSLIHELKQNFSIYYQLEAKTGDTTLQILERTKLLEDKQFDDVMTSAGVNDVTKLISPKSWIKQQKRFYAEIETRFSPLMILATGVPTMNLFPALPNPLGWLFGQYSSEMNNQLARFVDSKPNYQFIQFDLAHFKVLNLEMAKDGFHPSKEIYQLWAGEIAKKIRGHF